VGREKLAAYIADKRIDARILDLDEPTPTVEAAAAALGINPAQIIKSILFLIKEKSGAFRPLLVITNGTERIDYVSLARFAGTSRRRIRIAGADQVEELTGFPVGTVPPFGHRKQLPTVVDEGVLQQDVVYGGGGTLHALMRVSVAELQRVLPDAQVLAVTQSTTTS
jgi:prolyl-tRNA editing enzyme YbaK/EbsC (Cys-tRNA(Pro) deacylase)